MDKRPNRIQLIDAIRGLCVVLMCAHHFMYDLVVFLHAPDWLFSNPVFDVLHYIFAGTFIVLSGMSSNFSRSNVRRGVKTFAAAIVITAVTMVMDMPILFGVLHLLGFCMIFYGLTERLWKKIPGRFAPWLYIALTAFSAVLIARVHIDSKILWPLGITYPGFYSADYFPIFPWLFVFLFGTWLGVPVREGKLPRRFYTVDVPVLPAIGRKAFIIYLLHQPVLYGITMLLKLLL